MTQEQENYWSIVWGQFRHHRLGYASLFVVAAFVIVGTYAPLLASSKPLIVWWDGQWRFPIFNYLFHAGFYTKRLDIFYNILMFTLPVGILIRYMKWFRFPLFLLLAAVHTTAFIYYGYFEVADPASDPALNTRRHEVMQQRRSGGATGDRLLAPLDPGPSWEFDLQYLNEHARLNAVVRHELRRRQDKRLQQYRDGYRETALSRWLVTAVVAKRRELLASGIAMSDIPPSEILRQRILDETPPEILEEVVVVPTLWQVELDNEADQIAVQRAVMENLEAAYPEAKMKLMPVLEKCQGLAEEHLRLQRQHQVDSWRLQQLRERVGGANSKLADELQESLKRITLRCDAINELTDMERGRISNLRQTVERYEVAHAKIRYILERRVWLDQQASQLHYLLMPILRDFHWEDDAGGEQSINKFLPWYERTRINRKDLLAGLLFGIRISLVVGLLAVGLAVLIGVPIGAIAGYYGGKFDIVVSRLLEIWESMPTFFMLLLVVAITQTKSIFLVIGVIGLFGWTGFSRYIRGEVFKQRNLAYVEASHAMGFSDRRIIFGHILPNAIPPLLTLLPFAIMGAITSEAGLSFLGLGEEGSCSWGVLMDEGRSVFPGESYLLWPPAILLTGLLVAIALVGDALRDCLDPKMRR
ncbi:hypothetical protein SCG7086_AK_00090 [Chlamydiales bacterium SCGC AG-110-P3]|nr:hypothetical protein SCG7086_AK_00090 [Chlamydiales bacterium SCGC AG-110-P3]